MGVNETMLAVLVDGKLVALSTVDGKDYWTIVDYGALRAESLAKKLIA